MTWEVQFQTPEGWFFYATPPFTRYEALAYLTAARRPGVRYRIRYVYHWTNQ